MDVQGIPRDTIRIVPYMTIRTYNKYEKDVYGHGHRFPAGLDKAWIFALAGGNGLCCTR